MQNSTLDHYLQSGTAGAAFLTITIALVESSLAIILQISVGVVLSHPKINVLGKNVIRGISTVLLNAVLPLFVFFQFAVSIDLPLLREVIVAPVAGLIVSVIQFLIGELFFFDYSVFCKKRTLFREQQRKIPRNMLKLCVMFNNYIVIPYAVLNGFTNMNVFKDPKKEAHAMAFVTLYYFPVIALFFSFGHFYAGADETRDLGELNDDTMLNNTRRPHPNEPPTKIRKTVKKVWELLKRFVPPPVLGMVLGIIAGVIPEVKGFIFLNPPIFISVIPKVLQQYSNCVLPLSFLITGGNVGNLFWSALSRPAKPEGMTPEVVAIELEEQRKEKELDDEIASLISEHESFLGDETGESDRQSTQSSRFSDHDISGRRVSEADIGGSEHSKSVSLGSSSSERSVFSTLKRLWIIRNLSLPTAICVTLAKLVISPIIVFVILALVSYLFPEIMMTDPELRPIMYLVICIEAACPVTMTLNMLASIYNVGIDEVAEVTLLHHFLAPFTMIPMGVGFLYYFCWVTSPDGCHGY